MLIHLSWEFPVFFDSLINYYSSETHFSMTMKQLQDIFWLQRASLGQSSSLWRALRIKFLISLVKLSSVECESNEKEVVDLKIESLRSNESVTRLAVGNLSRFSQIEKVVTQILLTKFPIICKHLWRSFKKKNVKFLKHFVENVLSSSTREV